MCIIVPVLAALVLAADQLSKQAVLAALEPGVPVPIWGDALVFVLVFNPGAAFSLGEGVTWIFTIALAAVAIVIAVLTVTRVRARSWAIVLGLLAGGVLGNLSDRLFREPGFPVGHVVDFISTPWMMPAIYNVADIFIVGNMILIALFVLLGIGWDGRRVRAEQVKAPEQGEQAAEADAAASAPDSTAERS